MPVPVAVPVAIAGASLVKGAFDYFGGKAERKAAEAARKDMYKRGAAAAEGVREAGARARDSMTWGLQEASRGYAGAQGTLQAEKDTLAGRFGSQIEAGDAALGRMRDILMGADPRAGMERFDVGQVLAQDQGYQFALAEGNKALERAARASGGFGGGANLKDFIRFGQQTATQYADKALERERQRREDIYAREQDLLRNLSGMQSIGGKATALEATLSGNLASGISGLQADAGSKSADIATQIAQLGQQNEIAAGNLQMGYSQQAQPYQQQAVSGAGAGYRAAGQGISDTMRTIAYMYGTGGFGGGGGGGAETFEL